MMVLLKRLVFNQRGDIHLFTVFMTLFFFMFISIASTWVGIGGGGYYAGGSYQAHGLQHAGTAYRDDDSGAGA
ncbi:MAG: hypothetical protein IJA67_02240, partial [Oscillospiraceae bacterium]|nr:hypothetical protein [Oscillospiraceae bacterium]